MFSMWFKKITLHPFWRILIFLIGIFSAKTRGIFFCPFLQRCRTSGSLLKYHYSIFIILNLFPHEILKGRVVIFDFDR